MTVFFTSDTHFGHANIIRLSNRPFADVDEMNKTMVKNWNSVVKPTDIVYHLGDFSFRSKSDDSVYLFRLQGRKHLILGNHDKPNTIADHGWETVRDYAEVTINNVKIILFHYPIASWNGIHKGSIHFHGHTHGNLPQTGNRFDVGVDVWNFTPVTVDQVLHKTLET